MRKNPDHSEADRDLVVQLLKDIFQATGIRYSSIGQIPVTDERLSRAVLPILSTAVPRAESAALRGGIYQRFVYKYSSPYMDQMLQWRQLEKSEMDRSMVTQAIAWGVRAEHAEKVWDVLQNTPVNEYDYMILSKLAKFPAVSAAVKERLVEDLRTKKLQSHQLREIAKVTDPRIRNWFLERQNDPDPDTRRLARRMAKKGLPLPRGFQRSEVEPVRMNERFSTETDCDELPELMSELAERYQLRLPAALKSGSFAEQLPVQQWFWVEVPSKGGIRYAFWFLLDSETIIEVYLLELLEPPAGASQAPLAKRPRPAHRRRSSEEPAG